MGVTIKLRGDTAANWLAANPVLAAREVGLELDTKLYKVGDGVSNWDSLDYWGEMAAHNHDGDYAGAAHDHDSRYYTESEVNALLGALAFAALNSENLFYGFQTLRGTSPTLRFRDTDHRSAHIHVNGNIFYILRGSGADSPDWTAYNGFWPLSVNLENNDVTLGGGVFRRGYELMSGGTVIRKTANQSISASTWTTITFGTIEQQDFGWVNWDGNTALYPQRDGLYFVWAQTLVQPNGCDMDNVAIRILRQGANISILDQHRGLGGRSVNFHASGLVPLTVNQYLQMQVLAGNGGSPYLDQYVTQFGLVYLGKVG